MRVMLPVVLTNGNEGRSKSWYRPARQRQEFERLLQLQGLGRSPLDYPVQVTVCRVLGHGERLWDSSSVLRGNYKELEDALVACGWFHDDGPRWIRATWGIQDGTRRDQGPAVELRIRSVGRRSGE